VKRFIATSFRLVLPALLFSVFANAQKLPNIQPTSLRAPANIRVDGKANEWNGKLQAYNTAIQASYTVSNDDNRLYLTLYATKKEVINKIINGGISFTVNKGPRKNIIGGTTVTYPVFDRDDRPFINANALALVDKESTDANHKADSLMNTFNNTFTNKAKTIRLSGLKDLDTLISVYNKDGIKARGAFDNKLYFTYELSIDLKLLELSAADHTKFNYDIRLNEVDIDYVPGMEIARNDEGFITKIFVSNPQLANSFASALSTTDCWGGYTLVK
jgi:hypothetical protein